VPAALIDFVLLCFLLGMVGLALRVLGLVDPDLAYLAYFAAGWVAFALPEATPLQGAPGKLAMGLRVTTLEGKRITLLRSTARFLLKLLLTPLLCLSPAFLLVSKTNPFFNDYVQAIHDRLAGTLVLVGAVPDAEDGPPVVPPPGPADGITAR